eukprot:6740639-Prymnesium_polylepis.1
MCSQRVEPAPRALQPPGGGRRAGVHSRGSPCLRPPAARLTCSLPSLGGEGLPYLGGVVYDRLPLG